jgi:hypothetical protein
MVDMFKFIVYIEDGTQRHGGFYAPLPNPPHKGGLR